MPEESDRGHKVVESLAWTGAARWLGQLLTWASTLVVARLLSPNDYGLVGMATVFFGLVNLLTEFGLASSVVLMRSPSSEQTRQLNGLAFLLGVCGMALFALAGGPLGAFYERQELPAIVVVLSVTFLLSSLRTVPLGLMERGLRFKRLALIRSLVNVATALFLVGMAAAGFGYWALVSSYIVQAAGTALFMFMAQPVGFAIPRWQQIREATTVSSHVLIARLSWYTSSNADFLIIGKVLGSRELGDYSLAFLLASIPVDKVSSIVVQVLMPFFSSVRDDLQQLRRLLLRTTEGLALLVFPVSFGLALVAGDLVPVLLGDRWLAAIPPLQVLAGYSSVRAITPLLAPLLAAKGETGYTMRVSVVMAVVVPIGFLIGCQWGTVGVASAWLIVHPIGVVLAFIRVRQVVGVSALDYLKSLWPATSCTLVMVAAVFGTRALLATAYAPLRLGLLVLAGALAYGLTGLALHRERLKEALAMVRRMRNRSAPVTAKPTAAKTAEPTADASSSADSASGR